MAKMQHLYLIHMCQSRSTVFIVLQLLGLLIRGPFLVHYDSIITINLSRRILMQASLRNKYCLLRHLSFR